MLTAIKALHSNAGNVCGVDVQHNPQRPSEYRCVYCTMRTTTNTIETGTTALPTDDIFTHCFRMGEQHKLGVVPSHSFRI